MFSSVVEAIFSHAEEKPEKFCVADSDTSLSYTQFKERILRYGSAFRAMGVCTGDKVIIEAVQSVDYLSMILSLHLLGAVFVPLERNCAADKVVRLYDASGAIKAVLQHSQENIDSVSYSEFVETGLESEPLNEFQFPEANQISEILFSTGTTGKEKGIVLSHRSSIALAENVIHGVGILEDNVELIPTPFNHSHALRRFYGNMVAGASVVVSSGVMNIALLFDLMDTYGVNSMDLVPSALSVLLRFSKQKLAEYRDTMRYIQLGTAPLMEADKLKLKELLPQTRLYNFYGSTESGCTLINDFSTNDKPGCLGHPTVNSDLAIVDEGKPINSSSEHPGLIAVRGPMNMIGYLNDTQTTSEAFWGDYILSSDEAYIDSEGDVILIGRRDDVINVGGLKVAPLDVEESVLTFPGITDCICISADNETSGKCLKLLYVGDNISVKDLREYLAGKLENYKVPMLYEKVDSIARTYNGKLNRKAYR